jgi:exosortase
LAHSGKRAVHLRLCAFVALFLLSCGVSYNSLVAVVRLLAQSESSHIAIVLPISVGLIYLARASIFNDVDSALPFGIGVMGMAALVTSLSHLEVIAVTPEYSLTLSVFLLVAFWIGGFCACFGLCAGRKAVFSLLFLYLLVPIPEPIMARMVVALQHASADAASALYTVVDVPVIRQGQVFVLTNQQIEVAKECSGIRSSIALLIVGLVFSQWFLRKNLSKILLVAVIVPLAVLKNGLRVFTLSVLANYVDPRFLSGPLHHSGGIVFFSIAWAVLVLMLFALRTFETAGKKAVERADER